MPKIFISYRREDSQYQADRLHNALKKYVADPERDVFIDVDNLPIGVDFADHLDAQVAQCDVLLALIGSAWLNASAGPGGARRLDDPKDFVRIEIASALKRGIPVAPVLLDGAAMPREDQLPDDLKALVRRNGVEIRRATFDVDIDRLIRGLSLGDKALRTKRPGAAVASGKTSTGRGVGIGLGILAGLIAVAVGGWVWMANPGNWRGGGDQAASQAEPTEIATKDPVVSDMPAVSAPEDEPGLDASAPAESSAACAFIHDRFPFNKTSAVDAPPTDVLQLFGFNGEIDQVVKRLEPAIDKSGAVWGWRQDLPEATLFPKSVAAEIQKAAVIRDLLASGLRLEIDAGAFSGGVTAAELVIGDKRVLFDSAKPRKESIQWSFTGKPEASLKLMSAEGIEASRNFEGPWSLFRLIQSASDNETVADTVRVRFAQGPKAVTLQIRSANSLYNPFGTMGFQSFRCPGDL